MPFTIEWVLELARFAELSAAWEGLSPANATPFDSHGWYMAWWKAFAGGELAVCTAWRDEALVAAFPLRRERGRLSGLANVHSGSFRPLATDDAAMRAVVAAAYGRREAEVEAPFLPLDDPSFGVLETGAEDAGRIALVEPGPVSPIVDLAGDFETWRKREHGSWKSRLARYGRKMRRDHDALFELVAAPDDLEARLDEGFRLEAGGWKGRAGTAIESAADTRAFYREIAHRFHARDQLRLSRIVLDGELVAFSFCLYDGRRLYSLKTGYDEAWRKLVPGLVLQLAIVERCFELGLDAYELLGTTSDWKERLAPDSRPHATLHAYRRRPNGLARYAYRRALRPRLRRAYRRLRPDGG